MKVPRTSLRLRVVPGATHPGIVGRFGNVWKVRVAAPAEDGKANVAVLTLLADALERPQRDFELVSGRSSRDKVVAVAGMTDAVADALLAAAARNST